MNRAAGGNGREEDALIFVLTRVLVDALKKMGYDIGMEKRNSGPINAICFERERGTSCGGSGDHGESYGIAW